MHALKEINHTYNSLVYSFIEDSALVCNLMNRQYAVITDSFSLTIINCHHTWSSTDVVVSFDNTKLFLTELTFLLKAVFMYDFKKILAPAFSITNKEVGKYDFDSQLCWVVRLKHHYWGTSWKINVLISPNNSLSFLIAAFNTTLVINFLSATILVIAYPKHTLHGIRFFRQLHKFSNDHTCIEKYTSQGFSISHLKNPCQEHLRTIHKFGDDEPHLATLYWLHQEKWGV